jgi:hypothetical protein
VDQARASGRHDLGPLNVSGVADPVRPDMGELAALRKRMEPARIASE